MLRFSVQSATAEWLKLYHPAKILATTRPDEFDQTATQRLINSNNMKVIGSLMSYFAPKTPSEVATDKVVHSKLPNGAIYTGTSWLMKDASSMASWKVSVRSPTVTVSVTKVNSSME